MGNNVLDYYIEHNISPENQNIEDLEVHYARRKKLYRQCGITELAFRKAELLEIGPGGGYNALAFFNWDCKHVDLVEANPQGMRDMKKLFFAQGISANKYSLFECPIEEFYTEHKYDIIVAEGFIPDLNNRDQVLKKIKQLITGNGIIVITCVDKVGLFIERIKRLLGVILTKDISAYDEKVECLTKIFKPQLEKLRGVSKLPEDWVKDNILNPLAHVETAFNLYNAIQYFKDDFEILGTSPQLFTDYSWSKDIWYDYKKDYLEQFEKKRLSLLMANMPEIVLTRDVAIALAKCFEAIYDAEASFEQSLDMKKVDEILELMRSIEQLVYKNFNDVFVNVFNDIKELLLSVQRGCDINMEKYLHFFAAFGRTQQYISFVKK